MDDDELAWHLIIDTPGPNQHPTVNFWEADWFPAHRGFHASLREAGHVIAAGPLPDREGAGQTLVRRVSSAEITRLATETDPAAVGGFLQVEIIPWEIGETILEA